MSFFLNCSKGDYCNNWRECEPCARRRQKRVADAAERLHRIANAATWVTITPDENTPAAVARCRRNFLAHHQPDGAIWTVEQGIIKDRLHLNILTPPLHAAAIAGMAQFTVQRVTDPRTVGAYISKREQMPSKEDYPGRLFGTAGPLWQYLSAAGAPTVQRAAALQQDIDRHHDRATARSAPTPWQCATDIDMAEARAIYARRLPDLVKVRPPLHHFADPPGF